ncbi:hypothetical protein B0I33_110168 [Prauserella shujinwangii]|uniref:PknH-like protein n=1 Tax=Prauserella shujinwangii TaxID=1453103 RepID=A0A2T0LP98_9PSEU|nr:hypothetical protein [Prauserella shujinwangii]PRX45069.1 hypothetical protein B0I33_110168 [Prauserella shujinwangii]
MRQRRLVIAMAVLAATALAGCADRPNDLDTYYDEPAGSTGQAQRPGSPGPRSPAPEPTPRPDPETGDSAALAEVVDATVLAAEDVAAEGVAPAEPVVAAEGCLAAIPVGLVSRQRRDAAWRYPTGSTLLQRVTGYPDHAAADVLDGRVRCAGEPLEVAVDPPVDGHAAWCADTACTILLARGPVLSAVEVEAGERVRAAEAVRRLAPIVAARLASAVTASAASGPEGGQSGS